jgi:hypothetical protein
METQDNTMIGSPPGEIKVILGGSKIKLLLGDIIQLIAPNHENINEQTFFIDYIDETQIILLDVANLNTIQLNMDSEGYLTDESIEKIYILSHSEEEGYARQNNLLPKTWIDIHIGGEIPVIISGQITNLDEDMIEVTTYPEMDVIYIDFDYKGIPRNIPFERFEIREKPTGLLGKQFSKSLSESLQEKDEETDEPIDIMANSEDNVNTDELSDKPEPEKEIFDVLNSMYLEADSIVFGEELEEISQLVELPETQRRYGVEVQANDLMDELLSTIPNSRRTKEVLDRIHGLIERFKQLRFMFSKFDENGNIVGFTQLGPSHKPLVERIRNLDTKISWLIPTVSQQKFIYSTDDNTKNVEDEESSAISDVVFSQLNKEINDQHELFKSYNKNTLPNGVNKYEYLFTKLNEINECFIPETDLETNLTKSQSVLDNMDVIVNNFEDCYSTVNSVTTKKRGNDALDRRRFVIQRYQMGMTKKSKILMRSGKTIHVRENMTPNDKMSVASLVMLPEPVVNFSHIHLPGTKLFNKTNLHQHYMSLFRILRSKTDMGKYVVDDLDKEIPYEDDEPKPSSFAEGRPKFLANSKEFLLESDNNTLQKSKQFEKFINVIIPKTRVIFRLVQKYIKDKLSLVDIVKELEPFLIYTKDITYKQYDEIRFFVKQQLILIREKFAKKANYYKKIRKNTFRINYQMNRIQRILFDNQDFLHMFEDGYHLSKENNENERKSWQNCSPSELLVKINVTDCSVLFSDIITTMMIKTLSTPENILEAFEPAKLDDLTETEKIKAKDCIRRYLAKKYKNMSDMRDDNGNDDVFYDKELDSWTPSYEYFNKMYQSEKKAMGPPEFIEFLKMNLIHKHDVDRSIAEDMAKSIVEGKKRVSDGEYATVMIDYKSDEIEIPEIQTPQPRSGSESPAYVPMSPNMEDYDKSGVKMSSKTRYFKRVKNQWVHDTSINEEAFLDTSTLFCNINENCFKDQKTDICESDLMSKQRMLALNKLRMKSEFSQRISGSIEEMTKGIKKRLEANYKQIIRERMLNQVKMEKYNDYAYDLGRTSIREEVLESPHIHFRDQVLGQDDFQKKQADIVKFVEMFCREPMIDDLAENPAWFYCRDTNTTLFPQSLHKLSLVFCMGGNYSAKLAEVCRDVGVLSDDGDSIVDKHTGYVLRKIDFVTEDEFTEQGMHIATHDILEDEFETRLGKILTMNDSGKTSTAATSIFENEQNQHIYNITKTICQQIGIPIESIQNFVLFTTNEVMEKHIQSEEIYEKKAQALEKKKGVRPIPYEIYKNRFMFWIISSTILISIQTAIPSFRTKKTFPGCIRSFQGYPLDGGVEDLTGIQYIACVMFKLKSSSTPWNSIERLNVEAYTSKIKETLEKIILPERTDIEQLYLKKREYTILHPNDVIPMEHGINRWPLFLPPVVPFSIISKLRPITKEYERELMDQIRDGHKEQRTHLSLIKSRSVQYGYAIIESINDIVKHKDSLLKTSSKIPFLENACCHDSILIEPLAYFINENPSIKKFMEITQYLSEMVEETHSILSRPALLFHPGFTGIKYPTITNVTLVENIYGAFFHYCHFDSEIPIPESLLLVCSEKPSSLPGYKHDWSMMDKIEFLKMNGKQYNPNNLEQLMTIVRNNNRIELNPEQSFSQVDVVRDLLESFIQMDSPIIEDIFRKRLLAVINKFNPKKMVKEARPELDDLKNYVAKTNERMYYAIVDFMDKFGNLEDSKFHNFQDWLMNPGNLHSSFALSEKDFLYKTTQNVKNIVYDMSRLFPQMILQETIYDRIPSHWGLASVHVRDLDTALSKYWDPIRPFFGDAIVSELLQDVTTKLRDLFNIVHALPVYSPILKGSDEFHSLFDAEATYLMFIYFLYSTIYEYIVSSENPETIRSDIITSKKIRKENITSQNDVTTQSEAVLIDVSENVDNVQQDIEEIDLQIVEPSDFKSRIAQMLLAFINIEKENLPIFLSYTEISKKIGLSKKQEKKRITDYLGSLNEDERKIEDQFKQYKMGRWNAGLQKGLVYYDKSTYERERSEMDADVFGGDMGNPMAVDVNVLEAEEQLDAIREHDNEGNDFGDFGEDYGDGVYYAEDRDPDEF